MEDPKDTSSYDWVDVDLCVEVAGDLLHELPKLEDTLEGFELQTAVFSVFLQVFSSSRHIMNTMNLT